MDIFRYWHKENRTAEDSYGRRFDLTCWGGSSQSLGQAKAAALKKMERCLFRLSGGEKLDEYGYATGQMREELIEEILGSDGAALYHWLWYNALRGFRRCENGTNPLRFCRMGQSALPDYPWVCCAEPMPSGQFNRRPERPSANVGPKVQNRRYPRRNRD